MTFYISYNRNVSTTSYDYTTGSIQLEGDESISLPSPSGTLTDDVTPYILGVCQSEQGCYISYTIITDNASSAYSLMIGLFIALACCIILSTLVMLVVCCCKYRRTKSSLNPQPTSGTTIIVEQLATESPQLQVHPQPQVYPSAYTPYVQPSSQPPQAYPGVHQPPQTIQHYHKEETFVDMPQYVPESDAVVYNPNANNSEAVAYSATNHTDR